MTNSTVRIGNENFKEWLRNLDPQTRAKRMTNNAITLYKMGQRGSEIKAALRQLSQRCQVRLIRLSEKTIKQYTRRKPLQNQTENHNRLGSLDSSKEVQQCQQEVIFPKKKKQKKKELMRELFGEEDNEGEERDKEVNNYLSTTVNVHYYNILYDSSHKKTSDLKRKSYTDSSSVKSSNVQQKRLRIDLSLSDENFSSVNSKQLESVVDPIEGSNANVFETQNCNRKKSSQKHSKRKSSGKKKSKKDRQKSQKSSFPATNPIGSEEDPNIEELWRILGMGSPTDRAAKFLSNRLNSSSSEIVSLRGAADESGSTGSSTNLPHLKNNAHTQIIDTIEETYTNSPEKSINDNQHESSSEASEPYCMISEVVSLANEHNDVDNSTTNLSETIISNLDSNETQDSKNDEVDKNIGGSITQNVIDTISLEEEERNDLTKKSQTSLQENGQKKKMEEAKSNLVGKIRVRSPQSLGLPTNNKNVSCRDNVSQTNIDVLSNAELSSQNQSPDNIIEEQSAEERFGTLYLYYFDESVETKIPILGEQLHLAIADSLRLTERIKRAKQLSSEELIKEETLRAEKDFKDMMKIRGAEFTPLCDVIVKRFDPSSKLTLFIALFCRILRHAGTIDPVNEGHMLEAKKVIGLMLKRQQYKDETILENVCGSNEDFIEQANKIQELVSKCTPRIDNSAPSIVPSNNNPNNVACNTQSTIGGPERRTATNYQTVGVVYLDTANNVIVSANTVKKCLQQILSRNGRTNNSIQGQSKPVIPFDNNEVGRQKGATEKNTSQLKSASNDTKSLIQSGNQQYLMHQQNNLLIDKTTVRQENSQIDDPTRQRSLINCPQTTLGQQNVNRLNIPSNSNSIVDKGDVNSVTRQGYIIAQKTYIPPSQDQIRNRGQNNVLRTQLSRPLQNIEMLNKQNPVNRQQQPSHVLPAPPTHAKIGDIASKLAQTARSSPTISRSCTSTSTSTPIVHAHPTHIIVGQPRQHATASSSVGRSSTANPLPKPTVLTSASVISATNAMNSPPPVQFVSAPSRPPSTFTSAQPRPRLSSALSGRGGITVGRQHQIDVLNMRRAQQPNQVTPIIAPNVVEPATPAVVSMDHDQLRLRIRTKHNEDNDRSGLPRTDVSRGPSAPISPTASSSGQSPSSPEVTSPTAEVNLPSSSHCHPFIARRPISGKYKMFFGNNNNV